MQKCACVDPGAGNKYINCWSRFQTKIALRFPACRHRPEPAILQLTHGFATRNFKGQIICATCYKLRSTSINLRWENQTTGFRSDAELAQYKNRNRWWLEGRCHPCETLPDSFFQVEERGCTWELTAPPAMVMITLVCRTALSWVRIILMMAAMKMWF
jgi:hypothetical protein